MTNYVYRHLKNALKYLKTLFKWLVAACVIGIIGGALGSIFHMAIDYVTDIRENNTWIIYFLPLGGLVIAGIYHIFKSKGT